MLFYGGNYIRVGKAHLVHIVAVKIHITPPLQVLDIDTVAGVHGIQAGGGQGLPEKIAGVLIQQRLTGGIDVGSLPGFPARRNINITF